MKNFGSAPKRVADLSSTPSAEFPLRRAEIMWGCEQGGSPHFPRNVDEIIARRKAHAPQPIYIFRDAMMRAEDRIWIMDKYFLMSEKDSKPDDRIQTILDWLHSGLAASDIRILTAKHEEVGTEFLQLFESQEAFINDQPGRRGNSCRIQINTCLSDSPIDVHDRFAVIDDELWHFGATVGGFHASVNAASRGWSAHATGAVDFFELVWKKCKGK
jgi:hypothetical protein